MNVHAMKFRQATIAMLAFLGTCVAVAAEGGATPADEPIAELNEALVTGKRLSELRADVIAAEDRMLARYNALNKANDFDIECFSYMRTGTRIAIRYCRTRLQARGQQKDGRDLMQNMVSRDIPNGAAPPMSEVAVWLLEGLPEYRKNLVKLVQEDEQLRELLMQRAEALHRYEAERGQVVKGARPAK